jgi:hypothetical protein
MALNFAAPPVLLEVCAKSSDEVVSRTPLFVSCATIRRKDVEPNMTLDHFGHQRIHGAPASRDIVKHLGALPFLIQCLFDGPDLAHDSPDPVQQPLLLF